MKMSKNFITFRAWYQDDKGVPQSINYSTGCKFNYSDYCQYPYFGVQSYVTEGDTPPLWKYQRYPIDYKIAEEHGGRSFRTILFSNSSGLRPIDIRSPTEKITLDLDDLLKTCFFDHVSGWVDQMGNMFYLLEPYSFCTKWSDIFHSVGFSSIEIPRPISIYQGGDSYSSSRSFLVCRSDDLISNDVLKNIGQIITKELQEYYESECCEDDDD